MNARDKALCVWAAVHSSLHGLSAAQQVDVLDHLSALIEDYSITARARATAALIHQVHAAAQDVPAEAPRPEHVPGLADAAPHTAAALQEDDDDAR